MKRRTMRQCARSVEVLERALDKARKQLAEAREFEKYGDCDHSKDKRTHHSQEVYGQVGYYDKGYYTIHWSQCVCGKRF
jgi:hypothetical protein